MGFNATLIRSVAQLCGQVDMRVCVEGVETEAGAQRGEGDGRGADTGLLFRAAHASGAV